MFVADTFAAFMDGLKPVIHQQIAPHIDTLAQAQTMAVKVDLHSVCEGKESGARTSAGKGGHGGGKSTRQKGKLGLLRRALNPIQSPWWSRKKATGIEEKELGKGKKLKKMQKANK